LSVPVTPTSTGTLQLQVLASAVLTDTTGNPLDTSSAICADVTITVAVGFNFSAVERLRVFLVGGQSNADGRAVPSGLPTSPVNLQRPQEDVDFYEGGLMSLRPVGSQFGPEVTLGRCLADSVADGFTTRVALIKHASGGTNLHTQRKGGGDDATTGDGCVDVSF